MFLHPLQPPFPPRLLHIPTNPNRYGTYQTLQPLSQETALPIILDGELGLPLEVGKLAIGEYGDGSYWMGDRSGQCAACGSERG